MAWFLAGVLLASVPSGACGACGVECDACWIGGPIEGNCDVDWLDDGVCDCGCQFPDTFDCQPACDETCTWCWIGDPDFGGNCPSTWQGDGQCDCGCQYDDTADCAEPSGACCFADNECRRFTEAFCLESGGVFLGVGRGCDTSCRERCPATCDWCWIGTAAENHCPLDWLDDGSCDCGCQFDDPGCPTGACCLPDASCRDTQSEPACLERNGVWQGPGSECAGADCNRCSPRCNWCWSGTNVENECQPDWEGDGSCDCGCQFDDATDCADRCGDNECTEPEDCDICPDDCRTGCGDGCCADGETATTCPGECVSLSSFATLQNCFTGQAGTPSNECLDFDLVNPPGVDRADYAQWATRFAGP